MRGRKTDPQFLSDFISKSVALGIDNTDDIAARAKKMITEIDDQIKLMEKQKLIRSKLMDVISAFEKTSKNNKQEDAKLLTFFKIHNTHICKFICDHLKNKVSVVEDLIDLKYPAEDIIFSIKQLIESKVLSKSGNHLLRGDMFDEYMKFVINV